jgi:hypothetical protein
VSVLEAIQWCVIIIMLALMFWQDKRIAKLKSEWEGHKQVREKLYKELSDPAKIEADFEKSARAREMRDAQRTTLPRENTGPPAKVHRPLMRGQKPGNWRLRRS